MAKNNKTRFFYVLYSDKTRVFDQSERAYYPIYIINIYINDLPHNVQSSVRLFADDALLYGIVANDAACDLLQSDLLRLESWQYHWQMEFNHSKCKIVTISHNDSPPQRKYVFCGVELEQVDSFPYLGVTIRNKLKWTAHFSVTAAKANKSLGIIQRNLWNCPKNVK